MADRIAEGLQGLPRSITGGKRPALNPERSQIQPPSDTLPENYPYEPFEGIGGEIIELTGIPSIDTSNKSRDERARLEAAAFRDSLTGLYSRRYLDDYIKRFDTIKLGENTAVIFCDADDLGAVNKKDGDAAGDQLIKNIAEAIKDSVREEDTIIHEEDQSTRKKKKHVVRKGGDEFVVIIENVSNFEELKESISARFRSKQTQSTKFSFGIVQYDPTQDNSLRDTIQRANNQMREDFPNKKIIKH